MTVAELNAQKKLMRCLRCGINMLTDRTRRFCGKCHRWNRDHEDEGTTVIRFMPRQAKKAGSE